MVADDVDIPVVGSTSSSVMNRRDGMESIEFDVELDGNDVLFVLQIGDCR